MFESDQHEFDDEFEELSHVAPPPPVAKQPVAPIPAAKQPAGAAATVAQSPAPGPTVKPASVPAATSTATTWKPGPPTTTVRPGVAPTSVARPLATSAAVAEPIIEEPQQKEAEAQTPEAEGPQEEQQLEFVDPAQQEPSPAPAKKKPNLLLFGGFAALVIFAIFVVYTATRPKDNAPPPGDMGPGIVQVSGLRGHLDTRWEGSAKTGRLAYRLRIEPMEDRWQPGFSHAVLKAPLPMYVNVRLLDATGFALCGKEIDFPFDPQNGYVPGVSVPLVDSNGKKLSTAERDAAMQAARQGQISQLQAAEVAREHGKDIFQNQLSKDGDLTAVNVQGTLPCAPDQFRQASYWDLNSNFPTLDQQASMLKPNSPTQEAAEAATVGHRARRPSYRPQEGFVIQGDDRVTEYDSVNGLLWARGRTFQIDRHTGAATATAWANNNTLIHYRCDQQADCALTAAGGAAVLHARLSN